MRYLRLIKYFMLSSAQTDLAYRANFAIGLLNSLLNLIVGVLGLVVLFSQVKTLNGWTFASTLALLGVYLTINALRGWFIGPSLEVLAGIEGDVWSGRFDFTLLAPDQHAVLRQRAPVELVRGDRSGAGPGRHRRGDACNRAARRSSRFSSPRRRASPCCMRSC